MSLRTKGQQHLQCWCCWQPDRQHGQHENRDVGCPKMCLLCLCRSIGSTVSAWLPFLKGVSPGMHMASLSSGQLPRASGHCGWFSCCNGSSTASHLLCTHMAANEMQNLAPTSASSASSQTECCASMQVTKLKCSGLNWA